MLPCWLVALLSFCRFSADALLSVSHFVLMHVCIVASLPLLCCLFAMLPCSRFAVFALSSLGFCLVLLLCCLFSLVVLYV